MSTSADNDIAIIGMALRVPGANTPERFWSNLVNGVEPLQQYGDELLLSRGVPRQHIEDHKYVKAGFELDAVRGFDPEFFGFSQQEAAVLDPQHRHFYETAWEALERAAHPPRSFEGAIGVFAGCGTNTYFASNLLTNVELVESIGLFLLRHTGNDKDFLSTRVSYLFDLKGPSINVQTACSTSLVATHLAVQSLLSGESDMTLAGGVTIELPHGCGYLYKQGEILSPDGHCRPFDHRSQGTLFSSGAGVVVLRRLADALADGDHIHAVIKATAVSNDGASKVGYLAPSVSGQTAAITEALSLADINPRTVGYIECHGTATPVGDPIEIAALTEAFSAWTDDRAFCRVGSVKSNIGHLDTAAGVVGLIKAALAVEHGVIPPSLNFEAPNPAVPFQDTPFVVASKLTDWQEKAGPRRAGVNSLGVGGTNAFVILEEPARPTSQQEEADATNFLAVSARNRKALDAASERLADWLEANPDASLSDVSFTLVEGRTRFDHQRVVAAATTREAAAVLRGKDARRVFNQPKGLEKPEIVFMFPGGGAQYPRMGQRLYAHEPVFRKHLDAGLEKLGCLQGRDFPRIFHADAGRDAETAQILDRPSVQLPLTFLIEYAMTKLWAHYGVAPDAVMGHSMGESTAACVAGVLSFNDALSLISKRGELMERTPEGGVLSVQLSADRLAEIMPQELDLAAVNAPALTVVSGTPEHLAEFSETLIKESIDFTRVRVNVAAHSRLLDGMLEPFRNHLGSLTFSDPQIPIVSNRTGKWLDPQEAMDPNYWVEHLRRTVKFADGVTTLVARENRVFLEVGPGNALGSFVRQHPESPAQYVFSSMRHADDETPDDVYFRGVMGRLSCAGVKLDAQATWSSRRRIPLPTYPFQHSDYWIEAGSGIVPEDDTQLRPPRIEDPNAWFSEPVWVQQGILDEPLEPSRFLVFHQGDTSDKALISKLERLGHSVVSVVDGDVFAEIDEGTFTLAPDAGASGYQSLMDRLAEQEMLPQRVVHTWLLTKDESFRPGSTFFHRIQNQGFYSLMYLMRAFGKVARPEAPLHIVVAANGSQRVSNEPLPYPAKATALGPCGVIPKEYVNATCSFVDFSMPNPGSKRFGLSRGAPQEKIDVWGGLVMEATAAPENALVAIRGDVRWAQQLRTARDSKAEGIRLRDGGAYLITGGLGGIGMALAERLARDHAAKLILVGRTPLPARADWDRWVADHQEDDRIRRSILQVRYLESLGSDVLVQSADVTVEDQVREVIDRAMERFGAIHGIIHAAGTLSDNLIALKKPDEIENVFAAKIYGTQVLDVICRELPLDFFVAFGSTSTFVSPQGQIDYVAANAFLNAFADASVGQRDYPVICINWGIWKDVGMVALKDARDKFTGTEEPVRSTLFTRHQSHRDGVQAIHALTGQLALATNWVVAEHRLTTGESLLPGTGYVQLIGSAIEEALGPTKWTIENLVFEAPLFVSDRLPRAFRITLRGANTAWSVEVEAAPLEGADGGHWTHCAQAKVLTANLSATPTTMDIPAIRGRLNNRIEEAAADETLQTPQEHELQFGPRWRVLKRLALNSREALADLELAPQLHTDLSTHALHPGLLDVATGCAMHLIPEYAQDPEGQLLWVPVSYRSIRFHSQLQPRMSSWIRLRESIDEGIASFDVTIAAPDGTVLVEIDRLTLSRLKEALRPPSISSQSADRDRANGDARPRGRAAESALSYNRSLGIDTASGITAFQQVLERHVQAKVIVSSIGVRDLIRQAQALSQQSVKEPATTFARPELDSEFEPPRNEVERRIAEMWGRLLGVDGVGIHDSFFDLGGHSLIAVRLFNEISDSFGVDLPMSVLMQSPTIAQLADLLNEQLPETEGDKHEQPADSDEKQDETLFRYVVPMKSGPVGNGAPLFIVAGMFGNVLNLSHLSNLLGEDRPVYALQARGLYGDLEPHDSFAAMAADYIQEMRRVQPEGPYHVSGFSGGGLIAYEIAAQLLTAGEPVSEVIMLDTPVPVGEEFSVSDRLNMAYQDFRRMGINIVRERIKGRVAWRRRIARERATAQMEATGDRHHFKSQLVGEAFRGALAKYSIPNLPAKVLLLRPRLKPIYSLSGDRMIGEARELLREDNGWSPFVERLTITEVPGTHDTMVLEPNVRVLADHIRRALAQSD